MRWLANLAYLLAGIVYLPVVLYEMVVLGKNRRGWRQRLGFVPHFDPSRRRLWIHAVSLGEMNATRELVAQLRRRLPGADIVFSATTDTGYARGVELYGQANVFRFPLDLSFVVSRALNRVHPSLLVLVEQEVWYNLLDIASRRGIPVAIVNGRLTARSAGRLEMLGRFARSMFGRLTWVGAQDEAIARRFASLGVAEDRVAVTSSLKWDAAVVTERVDGWDALASGVGLDTEGLTWVCGSTGPGEEGAILQAYAALISGPSTAARGVHDRLLGTDAGDSVQLVIVPRKPERFDEVARLIQSHGFACVRRSRQPDGARPPAVLGRRIVLGDTMGELRKFYCLADVVFVGRTLAALGGSDPMEVAALGKPLILGPHTENFALPVRALRENDAVCEIADAGELASAVRSLLTDAGRRREMGRRARRVVLDNQGATKRTVDALVAILEGRSTLCLDSSENAGSR